MSTTILTPQDRLARASTSDRGPLLNWLIFTGATVFAGVLLWRYGLFSRMIEADHTYISLIIVFLYVVASFHCLWRTWIISRECEKERTATQMIEAAGGVPVFLEDGMVQGQGLLPTSLTAGHIRDLVHKAHVQGAQRLDQTLLLRGLADRMRGSNGLGGFASDSLMKLGLLGTIIGFIIMLAPVAGLDASDKAAMKSSMGLMTGGMAVAMYTTLAGLVGSVLLRVQYYMLDGATSAVFTRAVRLDRDPRRSGAWSAVMIDDFGLYPKDENFDPFSVMLFKALQVVAFLFFIALLAMSPEAKEGKVDTKAEFIITMDWPDNHPDDLDLFVQDPAGNIAWYRHREAGFMVLDRDDRGGANDFIVVNGKKIPSPIREEIVTVRGIVPGEYTVNVSHFAATTGQPVPVTVKVQKLNPSAQVIFDDKVFVDHTGDEKTAVRFSVDTKGKVIDVNRRQKSLMETFRSASANGADLDPKTGVRMK